MFHTLIPLSNQQKASERGRERGREKGEERQQHCRDTACITELSCQVGGMSYSHYYINTHPQYTLCPHGPALQNVLFSWGMERDVLMWKNSVCVIDLRQVLRGVPALHNQGQGCSWSTTDRLNDIGHLINEAQQFQNSDSFLTQHKEICQHRTENVSCQAIYWGLTTGKSVSLHYPTWP